jgi:hypothetical protein
VIDVVERVVQVERQAQPPRPDGGGDAGAPEPHLGIRRERQADDGRVAWSQPERGSEPIRQPEGVLVQSRRADGGQQVEGRRLADPALPGG